MARRRSGKRLASHPVHRGRVVDLSVDRVRLPDGREADLELVHHPRGAAAVLPVVAGADGDEVLLLRQYRYPTGGWLLEMPAGRLEGDEVPADCARRELAEEAGQRAGDLQPLGWIWPSPGVSDEKIWLFVARELEPAEQRLDADEVLEVERLPLAEAVARARDGRIHDAKTVCALLRLAAGGAPRHG
jgi:ADP-ribose pyrophosphatase